MIKKALRQLNSKSNINFVSKHANCALPYCIKIDSGTPGPAVLIVGATHGNEFVGAKFIKLFYKHILDKDIKIKRGTIYLLLHNPRAHSNDVRFVDFDLNRSFVENKDFNKYEHLRAFCVENFFKNIKLDYVVDLHSVSVGDNKMLAVRQDQKEAFNFWFKKTKLDTVFVYRKGDVPGIMLDYFIDKDSALSIAIECGNHFNRKAIEIAKHEVYLLLSKIDMIDFSVSDRRHNLTVYETIDYIKTGPNFEWLVKAKTGLKLKAGQEFAKDSKNGIHKAPEDCVLVMPSKSVSEKDHDAGFLCKESHL